MGFTFSYWIHNYFGGIYYAFGIIAHLPKQEIRTQPAVPLPSTSFSEMSYNGSANSMHIIWISFRYLRNIIKIKKTGISSRQPIDGSSMCCDGNFKLHSILTVSRFAADGVHLGALATELKLVVARGICIVPGSTNPTEELLVFIHYHHVMPLRIILEHCMNGTWSVPYIPYCLALNQGLPIKEQVYGSYEICVSDVVL